MIALSVKDGVLNFISVYKKSNQLNSEIYGTLKFGDEVFDDSLIKKVKKIKAIKKSNYPSKKCMLFLGTDEVFLNKFKCPHEMEPEEYLSWSNQLIFEEGDMDSYSDYHYELSCKSFLSLYIKKEKQAKFYTTCLDAGLNLKALSLGILSADYLAREKFEAKNEKSYIVWAIGKNNDEILMSQDGEIQCILKLSRKAKDISLISYVGSKEKATEIVNMLKEKVTKDLKDFKLVHKIYMYQSHPGLDMKKIYNKKNKDAIVVLNPLLKMANVKQNKVNLLDTSYLSEFGYVFKSLESNGN